MKVLPVDTQSFEKLRERNWLYVDKTQYIHRMVTTGSVFFLARPRRFGKSLMVSTLDALFSGKKELFADLYIYDKWDWSHICPVVRIDWTGINHSSPEKMEESLCNNLQFIAERYQIRLVSQNAIDRFGELLLQLRQKTGNKVVILIDEYDKPVTSHLNDRFLTPMKQSVHNFYQVMKYSDEHIRFIFITGVSKFSGLSVFSALNNPQDITLNSDYAAICGYTQQELETCLDEHINHAAKERGETRTDLLDKVLYWYDGYSWDGKTRVYNPFSTLKFLTEPKFVDYWFGSATPSFMLDIVKRRQRSDIIFENHPTSLNTLYNGFDPEAPEDILLMFQTGYLTVKNITDETYYHLKIPNMEVKTALENYLLKSFCTYKYDEVNGLRDNIYRQIIEDDETRLACSLQTLLSVPYQIKDGKESAYHVAFQIAMRALGFKVQSEVSTELGRADAVWELPEVTVIAELKYSPAIKPATMLQKALKQIHSKRYYVPYLSKPVTLLAVAFTDTDVKCKIEKYSPK
jgi:hypothetical protein